MRSTPQRVLVVEDDAMIQTFLALHLENEGLAVSRAATGEEMNHVLESEDVDLIILDLNLPDSDGLDLAAQVRARSSIPIIVATARKSQEDRLKALGLGADDYLTKPFDPQELILRVRNLLRRTVGGAGAVDQETIIPAFPPTPGPVFAPTPEALVLPPPARPEAWPTAPEETAGWLETPRKVENRSKNHLFAALTGFAVIAITAMYWISGNPEVSASMVSKPKDPIAAAAPAPVLAPVLAQALTETVALSPKPVPVAPVVQETIVEVPADAIEETAPRAIAELLGYGWVLETRCEAIPQVKWWKFKSHERIAGYVQRRHGGDWTPYLEKWLLRLAKLQDILDRDSSAITNSGVVLRGEALADYIGQMQKRLDVTRCLAGEARLAGAASAKSSS